MNFLDGMAGDSSDEDEVEQLVVLDDDAARGKALLSRPPAAGVLSFHTGVEEMLLLYVERVAVSGDPDSVLLAVDNFCYTRHWMMHVGDVKGTVVMEQLTKSQELNAGISNRCIVEIGSYCGYSAVRLAKNLQEREVVYSIEIDERCRKWTKRLLHKAGLSDKVVAIASVEEATALIQAAERIITFLFIDHAKEQYVIDLKRFEASGLMQSPGCIVVADNILSFSISLDEYIDHVSNSGLYSDYVLHKSTVEYSGSSSVQDPELAAAVAAAAVSSSSRTTTSAPREEKNSLEDGIATCILR